MTPQTKFRQRLASPGIIKTPGIYDALSAKLVDRAGFDVAFVSGACVSFSKLGKPDVGLVSLTELSDTVSQIRECSDIPLIVDIDTGFGNALNTHRTVQLLEKVGASALQIEDQLMPKRCGHLAGKQVIDRDEMVDKIKAALDARKDADTRVFARTDALSVNGFEDALERAEAYLEAGAHAIFVEAPQSLAQMETIQQRFGQRVPLIHNLVEGGNSPVGSAAELQCLDYKIALYPATLLNGFIPLAEELLRHIAEQGETRTLPQLTDLNHINHILDLKRFI